MVGAARVARLLVNLAHRYTGELSVRPVAVNGDAGIVISSPVTVDLVIAFEVDDGRVAAIRMVRNPDKLVPRGAPGRPAIAPDRSPFRGRRWLNVWTGD